MATAGGANIAVDGLVFAADAANIKSYPGTGTSVSDLSGNNLNGTLLNGATTTDKWFVFDGTNDELSFPHNSVYKNQELTVEFWINLNYEASGRHVMFTSWYGFTVEINNPSGQIKWGLAGLPSQYMTGGYINYSQTYHLVCTYNPNTDLQKVYLDGLLSEQQSSSGTINYGVNELRFSGNWDRTNGKMGGIKIYNRELSSQEILQNYNATKSRFSL